MKKYFQKKQTDEWTVEQKTLNKERARETERDLGKKKEVLGFPEIFGN